MRRSAASIDPICVMLALLLFIQAFVSGAGAINPEAEALLEFRSQVTRDPYNIFSSWDASLPNPCRWIGIECEAGHVVKLHIHDAALAGTFSAASLSRLPFLRTVSLANNRFSGSIPSEVEAMTNLWKLNLSRNAFGGGIPFALGRLESIRMLDLSHNLLSGIIPEKIFENCSSRFRYISLAANNLLGVIPSAIGSCDNLEGIDFSYNQLIGSIPPTVGQISSLRYLSLQGNMLSGKIPVQLGSCLSLETVDLSINRFTGTLPSEILLLDNLTQLHVNDNLLTGRFPAETLYLPKLEYLNASRNFFTGPLPARNGDTGCQNLVILDLSLNKVNGKLPDSLFTCQALKLLNFSGNQLSSSIDIAIGELTFLHTLDLSFNELTGVIPSSIHKLRDLTFLDLERNAIGGGIPAELGGLNSLQVANLASMNLEGEIPMSISQCRFLLVLNLSNNSLGGTISESIGDLTYLKYLELQHNNIQGSIPTEIAKLTRLEKLDLSFNKLTGMIPPQLGDLTSLMEFNVSYNNLTGLIPRKGAMEHYNISSYIGNPYLCGLPLSLRCSPLVWPAPANAPMLTTTKSRHILSVSAIVAIAAAAFVGGGVVAILALNYWLSKRPQKTELLVYESLPPSPSPSSNTIVGKFVLFSSTIPSRMEYWKQGTKALLDKDCVVGSGPLGTVYRAVVDEDVIIAVKKLASLGGVSNQEDFERVVTSLFGVRHRNLVPLEGYYWSTSTQLLLYQFLPNDSLFHHLHDRLEGQRALPWWRRFDIAKGTARALAYLHHDVKPHYRLLNLKATNILLDDEFEPHISDYGLSRLLPKPETYASDPKLEQCLGYMAPELSGDSPAVTDKCDVYSFGVILLELVSGRRPVERSGRGVVYLADHARKLFTEGRFSSCFDPELGGTFPEREIIHVLRLGLVCTNPEASKRPTMAQLVQMLELTAN